LNFECLKSRLCVPDRIQNSRPDPINFLFTALLLLGCCTVLASGSAQIHIINARVAEAPPVAGMNAGYLEIDNGTSAPVTLMHVSSTDFSRIEIHRSIIENGMARMTPAGPVTIAARSSMMFEPGGYHLMLFQAVRPLRAGDRVRLTFHFTDGTAIDANAILNKISN